MTYSITARANWRDGDKVDQDLIKWGLASVAALLAWVLGSTAALMAWVISQKDKAKDDALKEERAKAAQSLAHEREQNASMGIMRAEMKDLFSNLEQRITLLGEAVLDLREEFGGKFNEIQQQQQAITLRLEEHGRRLDTIERKTQP